MRRINGVSRVGEGAACQQHNLYLVPPPYSFTLVRFYSSSSSFRYRHTLMNDRKRFNIAASLRLERDNCDANDTWSLDKECNDVTSLYTVVAIWILIFQK